VRFYIAAANLQMGNYHYRSTLQALSVFYIFAMFIIIVSQTQAYLQLYHQSGLATRGRSEATPCWWHIFNRSRICFLALDV